MAIPKKKPSPKLVWKKHPNGWDYANYKLGVIKRHKGKYSAIVSYKRIEILALSLKMAKEIIDAYTENRRIEL